MSSLAVKLLACALGLACVVAAAAPADAAKARKHKKPAAAQAAKIVGTTHYRGVHLFPAGPVYYGTEYLGDDPDPFIRSQILRDAAGHYGGSD